MAVTVFKRPLKNPNQWTLYLKVNFKGDAWKINTGLRSGKGQYKNRDAEKLAEEMAMLKQTELVREYNGLKKKDDSLQSFFDEYIAIKTHESRRKHINMFKKLTNVVRPSILIKMIHEKNIKEFIDYCESKGYKSTTIYKDLGMLRGMFNYAFENGVILKNPCTRIVYHKEDVKKDYLTLDELKRIIDLDINMILNDLATDYHRKNSKVELVRDLYLLQCMTGLRLSDVKDFDAEINYQENTLTKIIKKTKRRHAIPLMPLAKSIIQKYDGQEIPNISTQKYNSNLKRIAEKCNIDKHITSHTARTTFITLAIAMDINIYTVSNLVGHNSIKTTEIYANLVDGKMKDAIELFGDKINSKNLLPW